MAAERLAMRTIRQVLSIYFAQGVRGIRTIAMAAGCGKTTVSEKLVAATSFAIANARRTKFEPARTWGKCSNWTLLYKQRRWILSERFDRPVYSFIKPQKGTVNTSARSLNKSSRLFRPIPTSRKKCQAGDQRQRQNLVVGSL